MRHQFLADLAAHDGRVIAHYARFEQRFLDHFLAKTPWHESIVCTHAIARRLLPDLPRLGIRALSGYFGTSMDEEKRAAGHVHATMRIWRELAHVLDERGVKTFGELDEWLKTTAKPSRSSSVRRFPLPREQRLALPEVPGVYRMLGRDRVVLYVGKATSLKARVNSYYRGKKGEGERKLELVTQVWDLDITPTDTPLHAAILEQREIKAHQPSYNRQFRTLDRAIAWFDPTDFSSWSAEPTDRHHLGPVPSQRSLEAAAWLHAAMNGDIGPLPFVDADETAVRAGLEIFGDELHALGFGLAARADPLVLAEIGAHFRALDEDEGDEADGDGDGDGEGEGDEQHQPQGWTAEDITEYARWIARGVDRTVRRARIFRNLRHGDLEWCSPVTGDRCKISWRAGRVEDPTVALNRAVARPFNLDSYDETAVIVGELKRLIRYDAELTLKTVDATFDSDELGRWFGARTEPR
jgi:DNA polymerase-3 subunit epsilon